MSSTTASLIILFLTLQTVFSLSGPNVCTEYKTVPKQVPVEQSVPVKKWKWGWSWKYPFHVQKEYIDIEKVAKQELKMVQTSFQTCCSGYQELYFKNVSDSICLPQCPQHCYHGFCKAPQKCECLDGYYGHDCSLRCPKGYYGPSCSFKCTCREGSSCNPVSGKCKCEEGWTGPTCEDECPEGTYGKNCRHSCTCLNGATCDKKHGNCHCPPGYAGAFCEQKCSHGKFGLNCTGICSCQNGGQCHHKTGSCDCPPGWMGAPCAYPCPLGTFGKDCIHHCDCFHSDGCDPITGSCRCHDGWMDPHCSTACPDPYYGHLCEKKCACAPVLEFCDIAQGCSCRYGIIVNSSNCWDPRTEVIQASLSHPEHSNSDSSDILLLFTISCMLGSTVFSIVIYILRKKRMESSDNSRLRNEPYAVYNRGVETVHVVHPTNSLDRVVTLSNSRRFIPPRPNVPLPGRPSCSSGTTGGTPEKTGAIKKNLSPGQSVFYIAHSSVSGSLDSLEKPISTIENVYEEACSIPPDTPVPTYEQAMESTSDVPSLPSTSL